MRVKWWVGLVTIAVAAPFGARADVQATRVSVVREPATIRAVDTYMPRRAEPRRAEGSSAAGNGGNAPSRGVPTTTPHLAPAAAEMNTGIAAAGLTLLFGCVAILRGRRIRADA